MTTDDAGRTTFTLNVILRWSTVIMEFVDDTAHVKRLVVLIVPKRVEPCDRASRFSDAVVTGSFCDPQVHVYSSPSVTRFPAQSKAFTVSVGRVVPTIHVGLGSDETNFTRPG